MYDVRQSVGHEKIKNFNYMLLVSEELFLVNEEFCFEFKLLPLGKL